MVNLRDRAVCLRYPEVANPAAKVFRQLLVAMFHGHKPTPAGQLSHPVLELGEVLGALAAMDMDHLALSIDIGDLKIESLLEAEAAGVDSHQVDIVVEGVDLGQDLLDLIPGKDGGEASFPLGLGQGEQVPLALGDIFEEELDARVADAHGGRRPPGLDGNETVGHKGAL